MKFNIGFIPTLLLLIPVIFACFKTPADKPELEDENIIVFIAKCVGRFGCIGYMCLAIGDYEVGFSSKLLFLIWAVVALLVIALYWVLWIRHYKKGNHFEDIYGTGIPLFIIPAAFVLVTGIFSMNFMLALQRAGIPVECYDAFEIDKYGRCRGNVRSPANTPAVRT